MMQLKRFTKQVMTGILCLILVQCPVFLLPVYGMEKPNGLYAAGAVLMDGESGRILFSKNKADNYFLLINTPMSI